MVGCMKPDQSSGSSMERLYVCVTSSLLVMDTATLSMVEHGQTEISSVLRSRNMLE